MCSIGYKKSPWGCQRGKEADKNYSKDGINDSWKKTENEFGGGSFGVKLVESHWYCIAKNQWHKWNCDAYNI